MPQPAPHADVPIVVMGVQGSGKTTIGALLAVALDRTFVDGDTLHNPANRAKMAAGTPLTDEDRRPWLDEVGRVLGSGPLVVGCSALRRRYRDQLRSHAPDAVMVHGHGSAELLRARVGVRVHEYMPPTLLDSQLATLEPLAEDEAGLVVDIAETPEQIVARVLAWLDLPDARSHPGDG
ncbi:gluconokinase [Auraticoccus monumenti]|uniref:Gluconokinase n=1 Tax=Auraticoccus monumenti TaxID=675864 RepID=A0A1G7D5P6_9ACTN|nr:gluconokinase [Auraticoccus monumenti]SDE46892.1 gluconokinase [Auraticoccus monumenti]